MNHPRPNMAPNLPALVVRWLDVRRVRRGGDGARAERRGAAAAPRTSEARLHDQEDDLAAPPAGDRRLRPDEDMLPVGPHRGATGAGDLGQRRVAERDVDP